MGRGLACSVGKVCFFCAEEGVAGEVRGGEEARLGVWARQYNGPALGKERLTVVKYPDHGVVLEILPNPREINLYRDIQLVQKIRRTDPRHLEQGWRDDGARGEDDLPVAKHLLSRRLG